MKKIKLFALAVMAMLSTNAFADTEDATSLFKFTYDASGNATIIGFVVDPEAAKVKDLEIPATLPTTAADPGEVKVIAINAGAFADNTQIETLTIADENVATINNNAFKGCTNLTTVTIGKAVGTIGAAFAGCSKLATVTFNATTAASQSIADGAFAGTAIETLDLTNTKVLAINKLFIDGDNTTNAKLTTITIPASMTSIAGEAFNGCTKLATVNFVAATAAQTIGAAAFANTAIKSLDLTNTKVATLERVFTELDGGKVLANIALESVTLPATLTTIKTQAFHSCAKLSSVDFTACVKLATLEDYVFGTTPSLTAIDFSKCTALKYFTSDGAVKGTNTYTSPFIPAATSNNNYLTEITLPEGLADMGVALSYLPKLATVNISKTAITLLAANALTGSELITTLELPKTCVSIVAGALNGSKVATLTINGDIAANGVDAVATLPVAGFTPLTTVIFNGKLTAEGAIKDGAFSKATKLSSVTFNGEMIKDAVAAGAFGGAGSANTTTYKLTVTWAPTTATAAFAKLAFLASDYAGTNPTTKAVKLITKGAVKTLEEAVPLWNVDYEESDAVSQDYELEVNAPEGSSFFYGKHYKGVGQNYKIAKNQDGATVIVYGAYVDQSDAKIYMEQLHIIGGYYYVPGGNAVVVKSTSSAKVNVEKDDDGTENSMNYVTGGATPVNEITPLPSATIGATLIDGDPTVHYYAMASTKKYGLQWMKFKPTTTLPAGTFIVTVPANKDAARLEVIWLDGSEDEATAIKTVKSANAENGAIFNLAGQKVNASYKGVVIKDGKKYMQK